TSGNGPTGRSERIEKPRSKANAQFAPFPGLRYSGKDLPGAQTERRAGYPRSGSSGPVRVLLGGETHRPTLLVNLVPAPEGRPSLATGGSPWNPPPAPASAP